MTTSDARKRLTEAIDRLERTRTHSINPQTGQFTRLDQESDTMTDHQLSADNLINEVWMDTGDLAQVHALLAIHDTLAEIRDRLPERETDKAEPAPVPHPDEALAKVLHDADSNGHFSWEGTGLETRADYLRMARAAREHIEAEMDKCYAKEDATAHDRAEKAEADLARVTRERDEAIGTTRRYSEALDGLRYHFDNHPAPTVYPSAVARRIKWRMEEVGILARDDARAEGQS